MKPVCIRTALCNTLMAGSIVLASSLQASDNKPQAEILHWWSSEGEAAALNVFLDEFKARGGHYYDSSKNNQTANREEAIDRMSKGYPSTLTQWNAGRDVNEFFDFGLTDAITDPALVAKLKRTLPAPVLDAVTHRGKIVAIPINVHSENWLWHSTKLIKQNKEVFTKDWRKLVEHGERLAKQDIPLFAVGDQSWQVRILFTSVLLAISRDVHKELYMTTEDTVAGWTEFKDVLTAFSHFAKYSKSFGDGNWNTQVRAVANNEAGGTFMGDWAKGEFQVLGKTAGVEYGCSLTASDNPSLLLVIDSFILGKVDIEEEKQGQALMLDIVSDPDVNLQFNALKGSVSPYKKPAADALDICSAQVYDILSNKEAVMPPYAAYAHNGSMHAIDTEIYRLWKDAADSTDLNATVETSIANFTEILRERKKVFMEGVEDSGSMATVEE